MRGRAARDCRTAPTLSSGRHRLIGLGSCDRSRVYDISPVMLFEIWFLSTALERFDPTSTPVVCHFGRVPAAGCDLFGLHTAARADARALHAAASEAPGGSIA